MLSRRVLIGSGLSIPLLAYCGFFSPSPIVRFRLNIAATIDGQARRTSNVFQVQYKDYRNWDPSGVIGPWPGFVSGNALTLDCGPKGRLFFLFGSLSSLNQHGFMGSQSMLLSAMPGNMDSWPEKRALFDKLKQQPGEYEVKEPWWPVMIRFRDISDIRTAQIVHRDELPAIYGGDSRIDRISFQFTEEPPSQGIEKSLPWWSELEAYQGPFIPESERPIYLLLEKRHFRPTKQRVSL